MEWLQITWTKIGLLVVGVGAACAGLVRLLLESTIKEGVKTAFEHELEDHKAAVDLMKQEALKDFGLFAEKNTK
jgi:hypothetical protein